MQSSTHFTRMSVLGYFRSELTRGYLLEGAQEKFTERRERVYTFMKTPRELEKFLLYGYFHCMDAFLFIFTFLPLRIVVAFLKILTHPCGLLTTRTRNILEPAQACDILKGVILIVCCIIVNYIDTSMMYHLVRGQAVIKLYVFYNMLDMADKLFTSFGQDILDALFWTATEPKDRKREHVGVIPHLLLAVIYVIIHTLLILFQATVLNVAFNSHNKALLTIMMSNNFVEIKSNMFKKIDKGFLYHIACSDVKERFNYVILLCVVFIRNMTEFSWNPDHIWVIIPDAVLVLVAELFVDWIKHAFIVKFNEIPADVYHSFSIKLAEDFVANRQNRAYIDYSDLLARRMGFTPLPLACLLVRICTRSFKISGLTGLGIIIVLYFCLMTFKVLISIVVLGKAYSLIGNKPEEHDSAASKTSNKAKNMATDLTPDSTHNLHNTTDLNQDSSHNLQNITDLTADSSHTVLSQSSFIDNIGPEIVSQPTQQKRLQSHLIGSSSDIPSDYVEQCNTENYSSAETDSDFIDKKSYLPDIGSQTEVLCASGDMGAESIILQKVNSQSEELRHRKVITENEDKVVDNS